MPTIRECPETDVQVESQPATFAESPSIFYSITAPDFDAFEAALTDDPTARDWSVPLESDDCRIYQIYPSERTKFTTPKMADLGIQVLDIRDAAGDWYIRLHAPDKATLGAYWEYCREEDVRFSLEKLYRSGPQAPRSLGLESQLTERQQEVARTATRMGYFDREGASAAAVADELGITTSTLSTHLRRINAKLFESMFGDA